MEKHMNQTQDIILSRSDAEALGRLLAERRHASDSENEAAERLYDKLASATIVERVGLPPDHAAMHSTVTYVESASGRQRAVTLALPAEADPATGRISVFSPVGRALLGQRVGDLVGVRLPAGQRLSLQITAIRSGASVE